MMMRLFDVIDIDVMHSLLLCEMILVFRFFAGRSDLKLIYVDLKKKMDFSNDLTRKFKMDTNDALAFFAKFC